MPANSVRMVTGRACAIVTAARAAGEPVRSSTSQAWVVRSSQPPHWAIAALVKYVRKLGTANAERRFRRSVATRLTSAGESPGGGATVGMISAEGRHDLARKQLHRLQDARVLQI